MEIKCVCVCVKVCVCVNANWLNGGVAMGVARRKKAHNFQMDSQDLVVKVGHETEDSWLTGRANWQKGGVAAICNKKAHDLLADSCNMAKLCRNTHTHSLVMACPTPTF